MEDFKADPMPYQRAGVPRESSDIRHPLVEPSLFYQPPYERPVEDEFAWHLVKYLTPSSGLGYQYRINRPYARFWVDFVVEHEGKKIGFEIGDLSETFEDSVLRDTLIVSSGELDALYRLRAEDLLYRLHDCLYLIARLEPRLFSPRGLINLDTLASSEAHHVTIQPGSGLISVSYQHPETSIDEDGDDFDWPESENSREIQVKQLERNRPAAWVRDLDRALEFYGISPDDLGNRWAKSA